MPTWSDFIGFLKNYRVTKEISGHRFEIFTSFNGIYVKCVTCDVISFDVSEGTYQFDKVLENIENWVKRHLEDSADIKSSLERKGWKVEEKDC